MVPALADLVFIGLFVVIVLGVAAWVVRHYALVAVARRVVQVLRLDRLALAVGVVILAAGIAVVATFGSLGAPVVSSFVALLFVVAGAGIPIAVANLDWYRASRSLPVSTPDEIEAGPVQLEATVAASDDVGADEAGAAADADDTAATGDQGVESSVTQTEAVAYQAATLEQRSVLGRGYEGSVWSPTSTASDAAAFGLEGTDAVVDGPNASFPMLMPHSRVLRYTPAWQSVDGMERTIAAEPGTTVPINDDLGRGERPRPRRYAERRIDHGNDVYVLGTAVSTPDGHRIVDDPDGPPLIVARCTAEAASAHVHRLVVSYGLLGLASLAAALGTVWLWL